MDEREREKSDFLAEMNALEYYSEKLRKTKGRPKAKTKRSPKKKPCPYCDTRIEMNYAMCYPCFQKHRNTPPALRKKFKPDPAKVEKVEDWKGVVKKIPTVKPDSGPLIKVPRPTRNRGLMK